MPLSTEDPILPLVANGDRKAVSLCIRRYGPLVWSIARRMSPTPSDAEDAVQEIFLDIWRHAGRFDRTLGSEKVFVATLARRRLIDRLRSMRTRLSTETPLDDIPEPEAETDTLTERDAEIRHARAVLATLPIPQQRVISLSLVHGMSHSEIANRTGIPLGTVKTMFRRGILRARSLLSKPTSMVRSDEDHS